MIWIEEDECMQRSFIIKNLSILVVLTLFSAVLGFFPGSNTGMAVVDLNNYKASLNGIGSTTVDFESPKILSKVTASTCYNHKKTGDYYRFKVTAYAKRGTNYESRFSREYPQTPNWFGGKGKKCHNFVIDSPSGYERIDRIVIDGINVKGRPRFSANFDVSVKPVPSSSLPSQQNANKIDPNYVIPQLPTPKVLSQKAPKYGMISASVSDFKLTQKGKVVDSNNIDYSIPLFVEFYIKNDGMSVIYPYYEIKIDDFSYYEQVIELYKNGAQRVKASVFYPKFPNLTPGSHIMEFKVLGTNYVQTVDVNFVGSKTLPKQSNNPPVVTKEPMYLCMPNSLGSRCLIKSTYGQCREGFNRDLTNGKNTGIILSCANINGNLDGCENLGSDCELNGKRGICYVKDPKNNDFRLRCYTK